VKDGIEARRMAHLKHSLSDRGKDWLYTIKSDGKKHTGKVWVEWTPAADRCVIETFWVSKQTKKQSALEFALSWLTIHDGRALATDVYQAAHDAGHNADAVKKAAARSKKIKATKDDFAGPWWWEIVDPKGDK
jgi:hypothetical protein